MLISRRLSHRALAVLVAAAALAALGQATDPSEAQAASCKNVKTKVGKLKLSSVRGAMLCLINNERRANGLAPLRYIASTATLGKAATAHAKNGAGTRSWVDWQHSHMEPGATGDFSTQITNRIRGAGWCPTGSWRTGEITFNATHASVSQAVTWWMNDPPHRAAILDPNFKAAGYGFARGLGDPNWQVGKDSGVFVVNFGACNGGGVSQ